MVAVSSRRRGQGGKESAICWRVSHLVGARESTESTKLKDLVVELEGEVARALEGVISATNSLA